MKAAFLFASFWIQAFNDDGYVLLTTHDSFMLYNDETSLALPFQPPDQRQGHVVEFLGDRVVVCGGVGPFLQSCYQLSPDCIGWLPDSKVARVEATSSNVGGVMYVMGGIGMVGWGIWDDTIEKLDVAKENWTMTTWKLPGGRNAPCAVAISEDELILLGGNPTWNDAQILNVKDGNWTKLPDSPKWTGNSGCAVTVLDGRKGVLVAGGYKSDMSSQFFDITERNWKSLPDMTIGGGILRMATFNKTPVVFGGELGKKVEAFDGEKWNILDNLLPLNGDFAEVTSVSSKFAEWLLSLSTVDWDRVDNECYMYHCAKPQGTEQYP